MIIEQMPNNTSSTLDFPQNNWGMITMVHHEIKVPQPDAFLVIEQGKCMEGMPKIYCVGLWGNYKLTFFRDKDECDAFIVELNKKKA